MRDAIDAALQRSRPTRREAAARRFADRERRRIRTSCTTASPPRSRTQETVVGLQQKLLYMLNLLQAADARPTSQAREAVKEADGDGAGAGHPVGRNAIVKVVPASLRWTVPFITMVVAATAIPVEWRSSGHLASAFSLDFTDITDIVENVIGFVPVGFVLGRLGFARAVGAATLLSTAAELSQIMMAHRSPSIVDVATNTLGAMLGVVVRSVLENGR